MTFKCKAFYAADILEMEHELLDACTTIAPVDDATAQRLNAIATGINLFARAAIEKIEDEEDEDA